MTRLPLHVIAFPLVAIAAPTSAPAQNTTAPSPVTAPVITVPPTSPTPTPLPTIALPIPAPTVLPLPSPTRSTIAPRSVAEPTPIPSSTPTVRMTRVRRVPQAPLVAQPTPTPSDTAMPAAVPTDAATPEVQETTEAVVASPAAPSAPASGFPAWALALAALALAALIGAILFARGKGRRGHEAAWDEPAVEPELNAAPSAALGAAAVPMSGAAPENETPAVASNSARATLAVTASPRRAGVNLLTATVDLDISVTNTGAARADAIAVAVALTSASASGDAAVTAAFADTAPAAAIAPFSLEPGASRTVRVLSTLPRSQITEITAAGRPMFVPVVAIDVRYRSGAIEGQTAQALAVGIERPGSDKLAPFWLDGPPKTSDHVATRPHGAVVER